MGNLGSLPIKEAAVEREEESTLVEEDVAEEKSVTILVAPPLAVMNKLNLRPKPVERNRPSRQLACLQHIVEVTLAVKNSLRLSRRSAAPVNHCR